MSELESRVIESEGAAQDPHERIRKLKDNQYYKNLQKNIKEKNDGTTVKSVDDKQDSQQTLQVRQRMKQQVRGKSLFKWGKSKDGELGIRPKEKTFEATIRPVEKSGERILNFLGYKVDVGAKMDEYKEMYQKYFIDSKSHNMLMAKFSSIKFGMCQMVLALLGISTEEIQALQKDALEGAILDNEAQFGENEYNFEMLKLFGTGKKDKKRLEVFNELRKQLTIQMDHLGQKGHYTKEMTLGIKKEQVQTILQEMIQEKQNMEYLRDFR